jgi:hypothetical protein
MTSASWTDTILTSLPQNIYVFYKQIEIVKREGEDNIWKIPLLTG